MSWFGQKKETTSSGISITETPNDPPKFERVYNAELSANRHLKITIKTFVGSHFTTGELTQSGGRWVLFEPERIADKILDPNLVPEIQRYVDEIFVLDKAYRNPGPTSFMDTYGVRWSRSSA